MYQQQTAVGFFIMDCNIENVDLSDLHLKQCFSIIFCHNHNQSLLTTCLNNGSIWSNILVEVAAAAEKMHPHKCNPSDLEHMDLFMVGSDSYCATGWTDLPYMGSQSGTDTKPAQTTTITKRTMKRKSHCQILN